MFGFTFNGKHSYKDFAIVMKSKNRPVLPEPKLVVEELPGMDGEYDYSEVNPDGRTKYKPRTIELECSFKNLDMKYLRIKAHQIASWLACGEQQLIFDDETAVYYLARVANKLDLESLIARVGRFTLTFKCRPFAFSVVRSNQQLQFGQGLMCGYGYRLDMSPSVYAVAGAKTINIYNPGTFVKPVIRINGSCTAITFASGGKILSYNTAIASEVVIDCDKMQAYQGTTNVNNNVSGTYLEFENGDNELQISGSGLNCTVTLEFRYLYL